VVALFVGSCKVPGQLGSCFQSHFIFRGKYIKHPFITKYIPRDHEYAVILKKSARWCCLAGPGCIITHDVVTQKHSSYSQWRMWTLLSIVYWKSKQLNFWITISSIMVWCHQCADRVNVTVPWRINLSGVVQLDQAKALRQVSNTPIQTMVLETMISHLD